MRKLLIILLGLGSLSLLVLALWFSDAKRLSNADIVHITTIVRAETTEKILEIRRQQDGTVRVSTGYHNGGFDGGGEMFILKWNLLGWRIVSRGAWLS